MDKKQKPKKPAKKTKKKPSKGSLMGKDKAALMKELGIR